MINDNRISNESLALAEYLGVDHVSGTALAAGFCTTNIDFHYRWLVPCRSFRDKVDIIGR